MQCVVVQGKGLMKGLDLVDDVEGYDEDPRPGRIR